MHGWGLLFSHISASPHTHKKGCQACETHVLAGLNKKMEIISFPVVHQNPGKLVYIFFSPCLCDLGVKFTTCHVFRICRNTHRPRTKVGFWWFRPPCRADRSTWLSVTAPRCDSCYSICERRLLHTCPPLIREKKQERNKSASQGRSSRPIPLVLESQTTFLTLNAFSIAVSIAVLYIW